MAGDLTDADRDYARRWAAARGLTPDRGGPLWALFHAPGSVAYQMAADAGRIVYESEQAMWDVLARALKRLRDDIAIPDAPP